MSVSLKTRSRALAVLLFGALAASSPPANAYSPVTPGASPTPGLGQSVSPMNPLFTIGTDQVWSKEYSHNRDFAPEQVVLWDGTPNASAVANGINYAGTHPWSTEESEIDALSNRRDTLFYDLLNDQTAMAFSHDDQIVGYDLTGNWGYQTVPSAGPITTISGHTLAGAGELTRGTPGSLSLSPWAKQADVDARTFAGRDIDAVELWGPEPTDVDPGDADKLSLEYDYASGWSLLNSNGTGYLPHSAVVAGVVSKLGALPQPQDILGGAVGMNPSDFVDLDASVVSDIQLSSNAFEDCSFFCDLPNVEDQEGNNLLQQAIGLSDMVIFSIKQIPLADGGYYATGSELFVLQPNGTVDFLTHGGQTWDRAFAESEFAVSGYLNGTSGPFLEYGVLDINALEMLGNVTGRRPGDVNADGEVNLLDLDILGANFGDSGATWSDGDFNDDGEVNLIDLDILGANFGTAPAPWSPAFATATSVPEPGAVLLLATAAGLTGIGRRRI